MEFEDQVNQKVQQFRKGVDKIQKSDNPYYQDKAVQQYEIKGLREKLEEEVAEINAEHNRQSEQAVEQAKDKAAKSYFTVTDNDRRQIENILGEFTADVALAYNDTQRTAAFTKLEYKLEYLSDNQLAAVRKQLPEVLSKTSDMGTVSNLKKLNTTLAGLQTPEEQALADTEEQAQRAPDMAYKRLQMTHAAFSDLQKNRSTGGSAGMPS